MKVSVPIFLSLSVLATTSLLVYNQGISDVSTDGEGTVVSDSSRAKSANKLADVQVANYASLPRATSSLSEVENQEVKYKQIVAGGLDRERQWTKATEAYLKGELSKEAVSLLKKSVTEMQLYSLDEEDRERLLSYANKLVTFSSVQQIPHLCWQEKTPLIISKAFEAVRFQAIAEGVITGQQPIFSGASRWTATATDGAVPTEGSPVTITWSFVPDGTTVPTLGAGSTSNLIATLNNTFGVSPDPTDLTQAPWFTFYVEAFSYWSAVTGNRYVYVSDDGIAIDEANVNSGVLGVRGDVRIGGANVDGEGGTLAFNYYPVFGGDMIFDTADSGNFTNDEITIRRFKNVIAHEHGHGLGIEHVCPINQTKLMEPIATTAFLGVQFDEVVTVQELYGDSMERHGGETNNNVLADANHIGTLNANQYRSPMVSIGNGNDKDFYSFTAGQVGSVTIRVVPTTEPSYLEGRQVNGECEDGITYNANNRQNLAFRVIDSDGTTVLTSQDNTAIGGQEAVEDLLLIDAAGNYTIEVTGGGENAGSVNNAQLYQLLIDFNSSPVFLVGSDYRIERETCLPVNGEVDPNEQVTVSFKLTNGGVLEASDVAVLLNDSVGLTIVDEATKTIGTLASGASERVSYTYRFSGDCGDLKSLNFDLNATSAITTVDTEQYTVPVRLGVQTTLIDQDFDSSVVGSLPLGLSTSSTSSNSAWTVVSEFTNATSNAVHVANPAFVESAFLTTGALAVSTDAADTLNFSHRYNMEQYFDGGILEISIAGGGWTEWKDAGGSFNGKDYDDVTIDTRYESALSGRTGVWSGIQAEFVATQAVFPTSALGKSVRVRWRLASDNIQGQEGWYIDDISLGGVYVCCEGSGPVVFIKVDDAIAEEFVSSNTASFDIVAETAVTQDLDVLYTVTGTANSGADFVALSGVSTITASSLKASVAVQAMVDSLIEGDESVTLTLEPSLNYTLGITQSASISILDTPVDGWKLTNFGSATQDIDDLDDFDKDGISNLLEYALDTNPTQATPGVTSRLIEEAGQKVLSFEFSELIGADIDYVAETSTDLSADSWTSTGVTITELSRAGDKRQVSARIVVSEDRRFLRIRVSRKAAQ